jgi:drug/metabolite transporter (DMT)-like permease
MRFPPKYFLALIGALFLWGLSFPILKIALHTNATNAILFYRYLFALLFILPFFLWKCRGIGILRRHPALFLLGISNWAGSFLQFAGLRLTSSTKSAILTQTMIVTVPLIAFWLLKERLTRMRILAITLSTTGAVILSTNLDFQGVQTGASFLGDMLTVAAVFFWAIFIVITRKYAPSIECFWLLWANYMATTLLAVLAATTTGETSIDVPGLWLCLFMAIFCTLLPTILYNYSMKMVDATSAAILGPVETISAVLLSFFLLGENLTWIGIGGAVLILSSAYLVEKD